MSCETEDKAIRPGARKHAHPPAAPPAIPAAGKAPGKDTAPARTGTGKFITPYLWAAGADAYATSAHYLAHSPGTQAIAAALAAIAGGAYLAQQVRDRRKPMRRLALKTWCAAAVWEMTAAVLAPVGPHGATQIALLAGTTVSAGAWRWRARRETPAVTTPAAPPVTDPRIVAFEGQFCGERGPLAGARAEALADVPGGFRFDVILPPHTNATVADVTGLLTRIAKLYDVPSDKVSAGYVPGHRSEGCARVVVVTRRELTAGQDPWDGESTYGQLGPGTIRLGRFIDGTPTPYTLHKPRSGAYHAVIGGVTGGGKTGTMHVILGEAGLARMCAAGHGPGTCGECDTERVIAIWPCDPQDQSLSVWRGRGDMYGRGPEGTAMTLQIAVDALTARAGARGSEIWTDERGRFNTGRGWFDPAPGTPLILVAIDEWPLIVRHPDQELRAFCLEAATIIATTGRSKGFALILGTQILDLSQMGLREIREMLLSLNSIAHRCDALSRSILGIKGDPAKLAEDEPGAGFLGGPRSDIPFRTKFIPENASSGTDVRHVAGLIEGTPIRYDPAVAAILARHGASPRAVLDHWTGRGGVSLTPAAPAPPATAAAGPGSWVKGLPTSEQAAAVLAAIRATGDPDTHTVMAATGLPMLDTVRALNYLVTNGDAARAGDRYTTIREMA